MPDSRFRSSLRCMGTCPLNLPYPRHHLEVKPRGTSITRLSGKGLFAFIDGKPAGWCSPATLAQLAGPHSVISLASPGWRSDRKPQIVYSTHSKSIASFSPKFDVYNACTFLCTSFKHCYWCCYYCCYCNSQLMDLWETSKCTSLLTLSGEDHARVAVMNL